MEFKLLPGGAITGEARVPGDKSISHRSIMLGALAEGKTTVAEYVAANGQGPDSADKYGLNLGSRNSDILYRLQLTPDDSSDPNVTFYLTAEVYNSVWTGGDPSSSAVSTFSLSGETNSDGTMTWNCVPGPASTGTPVETKYLPANCRG